MRIDIVRSTDTNDQTIDWLYSLDKGFILSVSGMEVKGGEARAIDIYEAIDNIMLAEGLCYEDVEIVLHRYSNSLIESILGD